MDKLMKMKAELEERENKGFTLMEMLIVVAIIAILIAIAIPVFTGQLEKAREATDAANIRAGYAEVMMHALDSPASASQKSGKLQQTQASWQTSGIKEALQSMVGASANASGDPQPNQEWIVSWTAASGSTDGKVTVSYK